MPLITEAAALSVAGSGLRRYEVGSALVGTGSDATVVVLAAGDHPGANGVQDSTKALLRGDKTPDLWARFMSRGARPPIHVFVRLEQGCLSLGTASCRGGASEPAHFDVAHLDLDRPLDRSVLDLARPVPAPGPVPGLEWVGHVETDPVRALKSFVLGWFPAEEGEAAPKENPDGLPEALAAFHRLARLRPAIYRFHNPVLREPRRVADRLVFAAWDGGGMDWSIPWPPGDADPRVWLTEDPCAEEPEMFLEQEVLSRFLLQFTLNEAMNAAPYHAWTDVMPVAQLDGLWSMLRPVPLSPFLPAYAAERFFVAPGLLTQVSGSGGEVVVSFGALHRGTLTPLLAQGFRWSRFDG